MRGSGQEVDHPNTVHVRFGSVGKLSRLAKASRGDAVAVSCSPVRTEQKPLQLEIVAFCAHLRAFALRLIVSGKCSVFSNV